MTVSFGSEKSNSPSVSKFGAKQFGLIFLCSSALVLSACASKPKKSKTTRTVTQNKNVVVPGQKHINNKTKFSSKEYGVKGSPRVTTSTKVRKGGGRYQVGKPYTIRGKRYYPKEDKNLNQVGMASWYGPNFHGRLTANGEIYDQYALSAAHPTMPLPSYAKVTNLENGRSLTVRVNDRGPYSKGRVIDLSAQAAKLLDYTQKGVAKVRVQYVGKARMDGLDHKTLMASYSGPRVNPDPVAVPQPSTMIAMAPEPRPIPAQRVASANVPIPRAAIGGDGTSLSAIDHAFDTGQNTAIPLSNVPVPLPRPHIFEEVPQNVSAAPQYQPQYRLIRRPLAYAYDIAENPLSYKEYEVDNINKNIYLYIFSNKSVEINLGSVTSEVGRHVLLNLLDGAGKLNFVQDDVILKTSENKANLVLDYVRKLGLNNAQIQ